MHPTSLSTSPATSRPTSRLRQRARLSSPALAGFATIAILLPLYLATAAPDLTYWDASEFVTAAQTLGIPHPPGTPLWVLLAKVSSLVFSNAGPVRSVTMLSVVCTALACALGAVMASRWIGGRGAVAAAVGAGTMFTVWSNATETEVYAASFLASVCMLYAGDRAGRADTSDEMRDRWRGIIALIAGFAVPLHLSALVALPAAIAFAWRGPRPIAVQASRFALYFLIGLSAVLVLIVRAQHDPLLNSGNPTTFAAMMDVLQRKQYAVAALWPRRAPLWLQIGNIFQWIDWQVAFGLSPDVGPSWRRTTITVIWGWLALLGFRATLRHEQRVGRALIVLALSGTIGVALWLNLRAGPSYGVGVLPENAMHEARERDYFFALGFWTFGLLAGCGIAAVAQRLTASVPKWLSVPMVAFAALPLIANAPVADRSYPPLDTLPRTTARLLLDAVPQRGVLVVAGDNDTFPLWYLQRVEDYRSDVTVVAAPLLGARWYRDELVRARALPSGFAAQWHGQGRTLTAVGEESKRLNRQVRVSALATPADRKAVAPASGWLLEGLVYAPSVAVEPGITALDLTALRRARENVPPSSLFPLRPGTDRIAFLMQSFLRCTEVQSLSDSLLVARCNGG